MKKMIFFTVCLVYSLITYSQELRVNNSFIITVNGNLTTETINSVSLILSKINGTIDTIKAGYLVGDLYVYSKQDRDKLYSNETSSVLLTFNCLHISKESQSLKTYKIGLNKDWFKYYYIILRIYDLDDKKYKKMFTPVKEGNYNYEFTFPNYSILQNRKN